MINKDFFDCIDTEEKAYWYGFICADGYVAGNGNYVGIQLKATDKEHLEKFALIFGCNLHKHDGERKGVQTFGFGVHVGSRYLVKVLKSYSLDNNKSKSLTWLATDPVPSNLMSHFIRGFFDGDGWVSVGSGSCRRQYGAGFIGTLNFISNLKLFLEQELDHSFYLGKQMYSFEAASLKFVGKHKTNLLGTYLYKDSSVYLERKKLIFESDLLKMSKYQFIEHNKYGWTVANRFRGIKSTTFKEEQDAVEYALSLGLDIHRKSPKPTGYIKGHYRIRR